MVLLHRLKMPFMRPSTWIIMLSPSNLILELLEVTLNMLRRFRQRFMIPQCTWIPPTYNSSTSVIVQVLPELQLQEQVQRVPPLFKITEAHRNAYDPVIISIGPYHYGNAKYSHAEAFKQVSLDLFVSGHDIAYYHGQMLQRIHDIRKCYEKIEVNNDELAWLILRDTCFIIFHLQCLTREGDPQMTKFPAYYNYFGAARIEFIARDLLLLENQIPFWIIQHVLCLQSATQGASNWNQLLSKFMNKVLFGENNHVLYVPINAFHLLGAYYKVLEQQFPVKYCHVPAISISLCGMQIGRQNEPNPHTYRFRSITDLIANGINLVPSTEQMEKAIKFPYQSGELHLPPLVLPTDFFVLYSNLIAYETSPTGNTDFFVSSFVNLMKALIQSPNDVKILRQKGILFNMINDDYVVKGIKDLDTFGLENFTIFSGIRSRIERHCSIKANSWAAELIRTNFKNPCTVLTLFAAVVLLCLAFLQTIFTILAFYRYN